MILYRPGTGALHRVPDALSRNPPMRDLLILSRTSEWSQWRKHIRGALREIEKGDDEDPPLHVVVPEDELPPGVTMVQNPVEEQKCMNCAGEAPEVLCKTCKSLVCLQCLEEHPCLKLINPGKTEALRAVFKVQPITVQQPRGSGPAAASSRAVGRKSGRYIYIYI